MKNHFTIILHPKAEKEYLDSVEWYEQSLIGLGEEFINEVGVVIKQIENNPFLFQKKKLQFREAVVKRFPYLIIYRINQKNMEIDILSVFHCSQNPNKKTKK